MYTYTPDHSHKNECTEVQKPWRMHHRMCMCLSVEENMADSCSSSTMLEGFWLSNGAVSEKFPQDLTPLLCR